MKQSEKILVIVLGGTLGLGVLVPGLWAFLKDPVEKLDTELTSAKSELELKENEQLQMLATLHEMGVWKKQSLPADPQDARRVYLQWVTDLCETVFTDAMRVKLGTLQKPTKKKAYSVVGVSISGEATFDQLRDFQYRFNQANVLHRIASARMESEDNRGNPVLTVAITVEGLALVDSTNAGTTLLPRARLTKEIDASSKSLTVDSVVGFPKKGSFRVRLGSEYATVEKVDGKNWTLKRGVDFSDALAHVAEAVVELAVANSEMADKTPRDFDVLVASNPFAIPTPPKVYDPKLSNIGEWDVERGQELRKQISATDVDPKLGAPVYHLSGDVPKGMTLDAKTGELVWKPEEEQEAKPYPVTVEVTLGDSKDVLDALSKSFSVTLKDPNHAPTIAELEAQTTRPGTLLRFLVKAEDVDGGTLSYSLGSGAPEGAKIDPETGEFLWTLGADVTPGEYPVEISAADEGEPSMSGTRTVTITVTDDLAEYTYLVGAYSKGGEREAWLFDRKSDHDLYVLEGAALKYAGVEGVVLAIGRDFLLLQVESTTWRLELGQNLNSLQAIGGEGAGT